MLIQIAVNYDKGLIVILVKCPISFLGKKDDLVKIIHDIVTTDLLES